MGNENKTQSPADEYRDMIREELYFLNYLDDACAGLAHEESMELLAEELGRVRK